MPENGLVYPMYAWVVLKDVSETGETYSLSHVRMGGTFWAYWKKWRYRSIPCTHGWYTKNQTNKSHSTRVLGTPNFLGLPKFH